MPAFFVHGVPETHHLWSPVIERLSRRDIVAIDLPGFGAPVPDGFDASKEAYVDWLIQRIEEVGESVDLVSHDWGCIMGARVASLRPDLIRTWAGGGGTIDATREWHPLAKLWQTPGKGEDYFENFDIAAMIARLVADGVLADRAARIAGRVDRTMGSCILRLYRSAVNVGQEWQPGLANMTAPAMVFHGLRDQVVPVKSAHQLERDIRARRFVPLESGHWFPVQAPAEVATALEEHWCG